MKIACIAIVSLLFNAALPAWALPGKPIAPAIEPAIESERCEAPSRTLPALRIETCAACELEDEDIAAWKRTYAEAAQEAGYDIDLLVASPVRVVETGLLPNGAPYVVGETAGMRFRVGDPDPGATLGSALGRMSFVIFSGLEQEARPDGRTWPGR
jgi:hypothetical protein